MELKIKKIIAICLITAIFLVLTLCFNSFAAVVSDNDGAAFITNELSGEMKQFNFSNAKY